MKKLLLPALALFSVSAANAWDYTGHMLVDQVAYENVSPRVRERVGKLVATIENKYNDHQPYNFVTAGAWMDDMRSMPNYPWGPLHYVDAAYTPSGMPFVDPPPPNVLTAVADALATLKNKESTEEKQSEALAMLLHMVGDMHQPLHCVDWNDKGGNGYFIYGIPFSDLGKKQIPNLHAFWDKSFRFDSQNDKIVELYRAPWPSDRPKSTDSGLVHDEALKIIAKYPKASLEPLKLGQPREWAMESHLIACIFAYPVRPHPTDAEVVTLTPDYVHQAHEIACERIAMGGYRLAALLEDLFGKE